MRVTGASVSSDGGADVGVLRCAVVLGVAGCLGAGLGAAGNPSGAPAGQAGPTWLSADDGEQAVRQSSAVPGPSGSASSFGGGFSAQRGPGLRALSAGSSSAASTTPSPVPCPSPGSEPSPWSLGSWDSGPQGPSDCSLALGSYAPETLAELATLRATVAYGLGLLVLLSAARLVTTWRRA